MMSHKPHSLRIKYYFLIFLFFYFHKNKNKKKIQTNKIPSILGQCRLHQETQMNQKVVGYLDHFYVVIQVLEPLIQQEGAPAIMCQPALKIMNKKKEN